MTDKTNNADSAITDAKEYTPEPVRDAEEVPGATLKAVAQQVGESGNPKVQK